MKYLLTLIMFIATPAWAGWTVVTKDTDNTSFFVDLDTLRIDGSLRKVWQKIELSAPNKSGWASARMRNEYDCKNETRRILSFASFSQKNLRGERLFEHTTPTSASDIAPQSIDWGVLKLVCSK